MSVSAKNCLLRMGYNCSHYSSLQTCCCRVNSVIATLAGALASGRLRRNNRIKLLTKLPTVPIFSYPIILRFCPKI